MKKAAKKPSCPECGVVMQRRIVSEVDVGGLLGYPVRLRTVPAMVCPVCGDQLFDGAILDEVAWRLAVALIQQERLSDEDLRYLRKFVLSMFSQQRFPSDRTVSRIWSIVWP